ncbi:MAG: ABC transporter ATP-binding protein [Aestuariivirga sp.]
MLEVVSVTKRFGGATVVADVSLGVASGEIVGLIGPNGAGKTTLFNLIAGSLQPSGGEIRLNGHRVTNEKSYRRMGRGLGRTFQIPRPFCEMTLLENLMTAAQGQSGERMFANWIKPGRVAQEERLNVQKAMSLLEFLGLVRLAHESARVLSGGQRKLLELGRVMMADPQIILLDEPGAGVNPSLLEMIIDRIAEINRRGVTVFIIEHNMDLVSRLCRKVFVMAAGTILFEGTPAAAVNQPAVVDAYFGGGLQ